MGNQISVQAMQAAWAQSLGLKIQTIDGIDPSSTALPTIKIQPLTHWFQHSEELGFTMWLRPNTLVGPPRDEMQVPYIAQSNFKLSVWKYWTDTWVFQFKSSRYCVCVGWVMFSAVFHRFQYSLASMHPIFSGVVMCWHCPFSAFVTPHPTTKTAK